MVTSSKNIYTFPKNFKWGSATSAHQVEGNATNSDWAEFEKNAGKIKENGSASVACEWWEGERWREDLDRAANDGQTAHRMSVNWSRIEPRMGIWDEESIDRYRQLIRGIKERGLKPMVTLHHFVNPLWLTELGGWENPEVIIYFERFVRKIVNALKDDVDLWCTINEINVYAYQSYVDGIWPPAKKDINTCFKVIRNMLMAHAAAYRAIHEIQSHTRVGIAHHIQLIDPYRPGFVPDNWVAAFQSRIFNYSIPHALHTGHLYFPIGRWNEYLPELANTMDYIGINYYSRQVSSFDVLRPSTLFGRTFHTPGVEMDNANLNELYPEGLFRVIKWATDFKKPIYITENGWGDTDENRRIRAMLLHLKELWKAVNAGFQVEGYYYWTLVDNFEWERGWTQPFGLYKLDIKTQTRTPRNAAKLYAEICKANSISSDMVSRYAPEILPQYFRDKSFY